MMKPLKVLMAPVPYIGCLIVQSRLLLATSVVLKQGLMMQERKVNLRIRGPAV